MSYQKVPALCAFITIGLWSCASPRGFPPPVPSPERDWTIVLEQSGGFAGVHLSVRVDSDGDITARDGRSGREITLLVSETDLDELDQLLAALNISGAAGAPSTCADCFQYELEITGLGRTTRWQGDDTTIGESGAEDLIRLLGRLRDEALSGGI